MHKSVVKRASVFWDVFLVFAANTVGDILYKTGCISILTANLTLVNSNREARKLPDV